MRKFFPAAILTILAVGILLAAVTKSSSATASVPVAGTETPSETLPQPTATLTFRDLRVEAVDDFLDRYGPKMAGLGQDMVTAADQYDISYRLLPAIGACEGGLGNAVPAGSYNTWGWGIYGGKIKKYPNWQTAITDVSKGIAKDYLASGLDTPEKIMAKYAPKSDGSWAQCVNKYLADLPETFLTSP